MRLRSIPYLFLIILIGTSLSWAEEKGGDDLRSAASNGLRTAHIARPGENGPGTGESAPSVPAFACQTDSQ